MLSTQHVACTTYTLFMRGMYYFLLFNKHVVNVIIIWEL